MKASNRDSIDYLTFLTDLKFKIYQLSRNKLKLLRDSTDFQLLISQLRGRQYASIVCTKRLLSDNRDLELPFTVFELGPDLKPDHGRSGDVSLLRNN